jgi:hypothetical protein
MTDFQTPKGFTRADAGTPPRDKCVEVVFTPDASDSHFELGTARFCPSPARADKWVTKSGDDVRDHGRTVFAWRPQQDAMKVQSITVAAGDAGLYAKAIRGLAEESMDRALGGEMDDRPKNVAYVAKLFGISEEKVVEDYLKDVRIVTGVRTITSDRRGR